MEMSYTSAKLLMKANKWIEKYMLSISPIPFYLGQISSEETADRPSQLGLLSRLKSLLVTFFLAITSCRKELVAKAVLTATFVTVFAVDYVLNQEGQVSEVRMMSAFS